MTPIDAQSQKSKANNRDKPESDNKKYAEQVDEIGYGVSDKDN